MSVNNNNNMWNLKEIKSLLGTLKNKYPFDYNFFLFLLTTGVRIGEAMGLRWDKIDLKNKIIKIHRSRNDSETTPIRTQSGRRKRDMLMLPKVKQIIQEQYKVAREYSSKYVFFDEDGNPCQHKMLHKYRTVIS